MKLPIQHPAVMRQQYIGRDIGSIKQSGCNFVKKISCAAAFGTCAIACASGIGAPACLPCLAGLGATNCGDCL